MILRNQRNAQNSIELLSTEYDGTEDPRPWIESLEEIGLLYHWADYIISRYAAMNMIGSTKTWLNLHKISFTSWENFKSRLIEDFGSDANKEEMKMRLNRMQQWNEPAIRFAEDILVLGNKVDPQMEEETKINWVIGGLKKEYSFALYLNPPKNTNDLLEICKKLDLIENNYQERVEKNQNFYIMDHALLISIIKSNRRTLRRSENHTRTPPSPRPPLLDTVIPELQVSIKLIRASIEAEGGEYVIEENNRMTQTNGLRLARSLLTVTDKKTHIWITNPYPRPLKIMKDQTLAYGSLPAKTPSSSPWSFPVILVKERDGKYRFCVDYRKLNEVTVKDVYPIPRIDDVMDTLQGSKYFSAIDLKSGYWQVEIEERDKEKTAFTTAHGLYEFNVMPFGLCNAPATFERNMDNVLGNLRWQICLCYLDDVIIYSSDLPTHIKRLEAVLRCFSESNLKLNAKKCRFAFEELEFLGHITNQEGIKPAEYNIKAVRDFPQPKKAKEVQSFLGMCSYYRKFIKDFSLMADPLTSLIRKNVQFIWTGKQEEAFQILKKALINLPILGHFDPNAATCIHTDASNVGSGATLIQNIGGEEKSERFKSVAGLSRGPLPENEWDEDYERLFLNQIIDEKDGFIENIKENLSGNKRSITQNFKEENGCLNKKNPNPEGREWLLVVSKKRRKDIMSEYHNHMLNGHLGVARTTYRLKNKYYLPSMLKDVSEFVKTCHLCQSRKGSNQLPSGLLQPIPPANYPFERIGIDFVGPLSSTKRRRKWIIVLTDYYTKNAETKAVSEAIVKEVSTFLIEHIFLRHGAPRFLISDRGAGTKGSGRRSRLLVGVGRRGTAEVCLGHYGVPSLMTPGMIDVIEDTGLAERIQGRRHVQRSRATRERFTQEQQERTTELECAEIVETRSSKMQDPAQERIKAEESAKPQPGATIGGDASSDPVVLNPNIDIPKYDGTEDPRPWIESLEEIGFLYHWADYIISRYAAMNMIGSAKTWLNLHKISFTSWENFKSRLIEDFASDANKEEMKMRLNRMQQWNEPAIRFAEDILVLCNKVDPQMEEETKINWVIGGLKKEYSFALHLNPPKNTNELLEICKKLDLFEKNYQERAEKSRALYIGPRSPRPHHQEQWKNSTSFRRPYQNTSKPQAPAPRYYQNTSKPQAPTPRYYQNKPLPQVSAPRRSYTPNPEPKPVYPSKTYNKNPNSNRNRTEDGRPICFKCNKPGHVARYCRVKASIEAEDGEYVIKENNKMTQTNGLRLARSLLTVTDKKTHIWITNPYPRPLKIMKDQTLAYGSLPAEVNFIENIEKKNENDEIQFQINNNISFKEQERLKQILAKYTDLFSSRLGWTNLAKHQIHTEDAKPIKHKPYRVSAKERTIIKDQIDEMLEEGIIRPSSSPWSFPVILVKKRDGKYRFCVDYRKLNEVTVKDVYPIPRIDDVMDSLQGSKYFSAIDLKSGYWQVEIEERDKEKTAFTTAHGLYEFNVMPFGLCNAPATFERNMENMLGNLRWQICLCYLDDVIIYSPDFPTHLKRLEAVFRCFRESNLRLNDKKCRFVFEELEILGYITSKHGIKPAEHNIKAIRNFPRPTKVKEVQSFLGMCSYYRKFIKDFSKIADPLTNLIKKSVSFTWTERQEEAFQTLKTALLSPPILGHFNPNAPTYIHTDASNIGIGATLVQDIGGEEKERLKPITFWTTTAHPPANFPFERIGIDFVGPLPSTKNRKKWIIVLTDYYTRYAETRAVSEATVKEVSKFLVEDIFLRHGAPQYLISDRGSQFTSNLMKEVMKTCKIKHCFTTSYHPQTNGLTKRLNRTLINMLSMYVNTDQKNWDEILPFITHAYNTTIQETTGYSPFFLMFGREPTSLLDDRNISVDIDKDDYDEYIKHHLDKINRTRKLVINNTIKTQERMKKNYDKKHMERSYEPGELVAVWTPIRKIGKCEKLLRKYFGPYRILKKLSNVNYLIEPKDNPGQDPLIVHVSRIKPYFERIDEVNHED
ncbi:hypothetical protein LAZ67_2002159, partial [Cordylochernes scorpioides]